MVKKILVFSLIAVFAVLFFLLMQQSGSQTEEVEEVSMSIAVGSRLGFDVGNSSLSFGTTVPGSLAQRNMSVKNDANHPSRLRLDAFGPIAGWVSVSENDYVLQAGENKTIGIQVKVPSDAGAGGYNGTLRIRITPI